MKKGIIGIVVIVCIAVGAIFYVNNYSEEPVVSAEDANKEALFITNKIMEGLKDYKVVIVLSYQKSIIVHTSINSSDKNAKKLAKDIEVKISEILKSKELNSVSKIDSYKIYVKSKDEKTLN
ncbi:DUF4030 domain-containing protein [Peribacillus sp. NPDC096379]|uniref:DUF4030 domain-containing protein n=1 Tax=Peribacillus sp. NPDC096379 TaxID=3364393 RepID=UPI0038264077